MRATGITEYELPISSYRDPTLLSGRVITNIVGVRLRE
jgi:hypothetical protein